MLRSIAFVVSSLLLGCFLQINNFLAAQQDYDALWKREQAERAQANQKIRDSNSNREQLQSGIDELSYWLKQVSAIDAKEVRSNPEARNVYFQRNDLYVDLAVAYAKQKDTARACECVDSLIESLNGPLSPITLNDPKAPSHFLYGWYAECLSGDAHISQLLPDAKLEQKISYLRSLDPTWRFRSYPYSTKDAPEVSLEDRIAGLSGLWSEGKYNFANFDLVPDVDWHRAYNAFLPRVIKAEDRYEYYQELRRFVALLRDSHTDVSLPRSLRATMEAMPPLQTRWTEGRVFVTEIFSPQVTDLGLRVGDEIVEIDGVEVKRYAEEQWGDQISSSTPQDRQVRLYTYFLLRGPVAQPVRLKATRSDQTQFTIEVPRNLKWRADRPAYSMKMLENDIAYIGFHTCGSMEGVEQLEKEWDRIQSSKAIIIDVRKNDGGSSNVGDRFLSHFIDKPARGSAWSTMQYRPAHRAWNQSPTEFKQEGDTIQPAASPFLGPVCVLTGPMTFSAGEDFVVAFLNAERGMVIGEKTGGSSGQPLSCLLPGGGMARFCAKRDRFPDGREFVGKGIEPTLIVSPTAVDLQNGSDTVLERAMEQMQSKALKSQ